MRNGMSAARPAAVPSRAECCTDSLRASALTTFISGRIRGHEDRRPTVRNTEIFGFDGDKISRVEAYFGWDVD